MVYRLTIEPVQPDFSLSLAADSFVLEKDKPLEIPVNVTVRDGLREPIEIHADRPAAGRHGRAGEIRADRRRPMPESGGGRRGRRSGGSQAAERTEREAGPQGRSATVQAGGVAIRIEGRTAAIRRWFARPASRSICRWPAQHHAAWLTVK